MFECKFNFLLIFLFWSSSLFVSNGQECKNEQGIPVDWFIAYKPPVLKDKSNILLRKGLGYIYITSKNSTANWNFSNKSVNETGSILGRTLAPLYDDVSKNIFYILYNDEPPTATGSNIYGHAKGTVMTDGNVGMWMIHSSPKFPIEPVTTKKISEIQGAKKVKSLKNKYFFPDTAIKFGQSFLCITLPVSQMNKVGVALQYIRPKVYSYNIPENLKIKFFNLTEVAAKKFIRKPPWYLKTQLKSLGGRNFISYAKSKDFNKDLYSDWLADDLQSDLQVETWSNGPNELPSNCRGKYHVMDVKDVEIKIDNFTIEFKNSKDHSKWAVTVNSNTSVLCIGDINRMLSQFKRGGGTVCYKNAFLWKKYNKAVSDIQPCSLPGNENNEMDDWIKRMWTGLYQTFKTWG